MAFLWSTMLETGHPAIDAQHKGTSNNTNFSQNVFHKHRILRSGVFEKGYL